MMHAQGHKMLKNIVYLVVLVSLVSIVYAPAKFTSDSDHDGISNMADKCSGTGSNAAVDAFGCSCEQKECKDDENPCTDNCGGPEATCNIPNSNSCGEFIECPIDKCVENTLHNYPNSGYGQCINGFCVRKSCEPVIVEESKRCKKIYK